MLFICLWFVASFWNGRYTWGFDYLQYYPVWLRLVWFFCGSGLLLIAVLYFKKETVKVYPVNRKVWQLLLLLLVVGACFTVFRNRIPLLGDGRLRINEITRGRLFSITEPLTALVHGLLYKLIVRTGQTLNSAELSYIIISIVAGLGVTIIYYFIAGKWFKELKWFGIVFLLSLGLNQMFYGYVESYALFMLFVCCYLWFGVRTLVKRTQLHLATISCSFAIACHSAGLFLVPSLCYLWWETLIYKKNIGWSKILMHILLFFLGPALAFSLGMLLAGQKEFTLSLAATPEKPFIPLWQGYLGDGILSLTHLMDILNQLLLIIPGGVFLLVILFLKGSKVKFNQPLKFLCIALLGGILFILIINPRLGARRDWDLFAWVGIPIVFLALFLLQKNKNYKAVLGPAAVLSIWLFWPWIGINASKDLSIKRYTDILHDETKFVAYGYENLIFYYQRQNQQDKVEWAYKKILQKEPLNARMLHQYGRALCRYVKLDSAAKYLRKAVQVDSMKPIYWHDLGLALFWLKQHEQGLSALKRSLALDSCFTPALYNLGLFSYSLNQWAAADSAFFLARKYGYDSGWLHFYWGKVRLRLGQFEKAKQSFEKALDRGIKQNLVMPFYEEALSRSKQ